MLVISIALGTIRNTVFSKHLIVYFINFVILGGAKDLSTLPFEAMSGPPESYTGCIRNLHVNNILIVLEKHSIKGA